MGGGEHLQNGPDMLRRSTDIRSEAGGRVTAWDEVSDTACDAEGLRKHRFDIKFFEGTLAYRLCSERDGREQDGWKLTVITDNSATQQIPFIDPGRCAGCTKSTRATLCDSGRHV